MRYTGMLHECAVASVVECAQHTGRIVEVRLALGFRAEIRPYRGRDTELWSLPASLCRGRGAAKTRCRTSVSPVGRRRRDCARRLDPGMGRSQVAIFR